MTVSEKRNVLTNDLQYKNNESSKSANDQMFLDFV